MVEGNGLENRRAGNGTVGSNPTLSANLTLCEPRVRLGSGFFISDLFEAYMSIQAIEGNTSRVLVIKLSPSQVATLMVVW